MVNDAIEQIDRDRTGHATTKVGDQFPVGVSIIARCLNSKSSMA